MTKLATIIEPALIGDIKSYWAMHFCAVFEVLYEHKNLKFTFRKTIPNDEVMSPANLVSHAGHDFFGHMKYSIHNWGLQYFMCHYLRSLEGRNVIVKLLQGISNTHNVDVLKDSAYYGVYVCGVDSNSGAAFLKHLREIEASVLGYKSDTIGNVFTDINYVDLCLLVTKVTGAGPSIAILGEVEGNHGAKLTRTYFNKKSSVCSFGLGVKKGSGEMIIYNVQSDSGIKTVVLIGSDFDVMADFRYAVHQVELFFEKGPLVEVIKLTGFNDVIDMVRFYWRKPVYDLIRELRQFIKVHSQAAMDTNPLTVYQTVTPKLIIGI